MKSLLPFALLLSACLAFADDKKEEPKNLLKPTNKLESWRFEEHEGGKGEMKVDGETIIFRTTTTTGTDWHVQVFQPDLELKDDQEYVLTFLAKSPERRGMNVVAMIDEDDWHEIGLHEEVYSIPLEFKEFKYSFKASGVAQEKKNRVGFVLGIEKGSLVMKDVKLVEKK